MKQIEYTEKQKIVLEVIHEFEALFGPKFNTYDYQRQIWFQTITAIKNKYGIKEQYLTLREYLKNNSCGAYHRFNFKIGNISIKVCSISEFSRYYNEKLLDEYYVIKDNSQSNGGDCENYRCEHDLELARLEN